MHYSINLRLKNIKDKMDSYNDVEYGIKAINYLLDAIKQVANNDLTDDEIQQNFNNMQDARLKKAVLNLPIGNRWFNNG